jgi:hypothetical protein
MNARTIGGIFTVVSAALGAMVAWTTRAFPLDVRLLIVVVVGLGVLAGATALFAHFGHALTGMKRAVWSGGIGFVIALIGVLALGATLALHAIGYEDVPCEDGGAWRCVQVAAPRDSASLTLTLSVQHIRGAKAAWWPGYWSTRQTGASVVREDEASLRVQLSAFARPTRYGVAYVVFGSVEPASLSLSAVEPAHVPALSNGEVRAMHLRFAMWGGVLWLGGALLLFWWPRLRLRIWPPRPRPGFHIPERSSTP